MLLKVFEKKNETNVIKASFRCLSGGIYLYTFVYTSACIILLWKGLVTTGSVLSLYSVSSPKFQWACELAVTFGLGHCPPSLACC